MKISEIFYSIQGEGPQLGLPAWFIRTSGCNLNCDFCDTLYANKGINKSIKEIIKEINIQQTYNVIITGGEPFIQKQLPDLIHELINNSFSVFIETNGTIYNSNLIGFAKFIVSPKPQFLNTKYLASLEKWSQHAAFKFVVETKDEFDSARFLCEELCKYEDVYFMPKCKTKEEHERNLEPLVDLVKEYTPWVQVSPRLHIYLWGDKRGV